MIKNVVNIYLELDIKNSTDDTEYKSIFYTYNYGNKYLIYNNSNTYIEFVEHIDIEEYISEYIDIFTENIEYIESATISIIKNNNVFITKNINIDHINPDIDIDDEVYSIKFYYKKYLSLLSKMDKEYNLRIYEVLYNSNIINTQLPIELLEDILLRVQ